MRRPVKPQAGVPRTRARSDAGGWTHGGSQPHRHQRRSGAGLREELDLRALNTHLGEQAFPKILGAPAMYIGALGQGCVVGDPVRGLEPPGGAGARTQEAAGWDPLVGETFGVISRWGLAEGKGWGGWRPRDRQLGSAHASSRESWLPSEQTWVVEQSSGGAGGERDTETEGQKEKRRWPRGICRETKLPTGQDVEVGRCCGEWLPGGQFLWRH